MNNGLSLLPAREGARFQENNVTYQEAFPDIVYPKFPEGGFAESVKDSLVGES